MPRHFPCTVSIDVKEFADLGTTRPEVVSKIINSFHPIKPIVAVQFVGYDAKVTFESEAHKREVMANEYVSIEGIECAVRGGGPRPQNVLVYNFPFEIPHAVVREALSPFGEVESVNFRHWTHAREICDGVRTVRMVRSRAISRNLVIDGFPVKISYPGQALECDICGESGHIAKNCSLRGKCLECRQSGYFQRNCPVRLRWLQRSVDSLDPVPLGDVSGPPSGAPPPGAGPPPVVLSGVPPFAPLANQPDGIASEESSSVDVRDNQLDELPASPSWLMFRLMALFLPLQARLVFRLALLNLVLSPKFQIYLCLLILLLVMFLVIMIVWFLLVKRKLQVVVMKVILVNIVLRIVVSFQILVLLKRILVKVMLWIIQVLLK